MMQEWATKLSPSYDRSNIESSACDKRIKIKREKRKKKKTSSKGNRKWEKEMTNGKSIQ